MEPDKILLKNVQVADPRSSHYGHCVDILIENDQVKKIGTALSEDKAEIIEHPNLHISAGWFDFRVNFHDPGKEEREDLESGMRAAIAGGFTAVGLSPQTDPPIDSKADIEYVYSKAAGWPVSVYPYGAITKGLAGEELSEMYDMYEAGAVGFSHGKKPLQNAALAKLALLYGRNFAPPLHLMPMDHSLAGNGQMHEGKVSTFLALKGIPRLAEEVALMQSLHLAAYTESPLHFTGISATTTVAMLRDAHRQGRAFTADVALPNLLFTDEDLHEYDSNFKVLPPLRQKEDRDELIKALKEDVIQVITSDHSPVDIENKKCEFEYADFGMTGLQTLFGALGNIRKELPLQKVIEAISINPRRVLQLEIPTVEEGSVAEFTLFDPDLKWTLNRKQVESKCHNSPLIGKELTGKALGIINNGMLVWMPQGQ